MGMRDPHAKVCQRCKLTLMKLLLTGGTGYIGSHSAVVLSQAGHDVVLLDNLSNSKLSDMRPMCNDAWRAQQTAVKPSH
jgi:UDP-glucose 4-epimerase